MRIKSYIADNIMREYYKRERYKMRNEFVKKYCKNCKNKDTDLCNIRYIINSDWRCINYESEHGRNN